jgi:hypothetical protein
MFLGYGDTEQQKPLIEHSLTRKIKGLRSDHKRVEPASPTEPPLQVVEKKSTMKRYKT